MKVAVTAEDITKGMPGDFRECPIALALNRTTNQSWFVGTTTAWRKGSPTGDDVQLGDSVRAFIDRYDSGEVVDPFEFEFPDD
jgi:hypothetical protein